ncbi:MAG: RagB/SusD family nutrient uptake outer membrane protein [Niabella sp.]
MKLKYILFTIQCLLLCGCTKFLDKKSDMSLAIPSTAAANQALLDRYSDMSTNFAGSGEASANDLYITDADFSALGYDEDKRLYTWQPDHVSYGVASGNDWYYCYRAIYNANAVLFNLDEYNISGTDADNIKGQALTFRAERYLDAAQIWAPVYNKETASTDLGLPLRLDPDMNIPSVRATVQQTYDQVIKDLQEAIPLLPEVPLATSRPSKPAALALLARAFLFMGNYQDALTNALAALGFKSTLMDYNTLNASDKYPIKNQNVEFVLWGSMRLPPPLSATIARIQTSLYDSYDSNDLRKTLFFNKTDAETILFRGSYTGSSGGRITSPLVDELYLIAAECYARANDTANALTFLNQLLITRWKTGTFVPYTAGNSSEALDIILEERRKELIFRGLRWPDVKRLNRDGANINLERTVNGQQYSLPANDPRYAIAIPEDVIELSGIQQNPR